MTRGQGPIPWDGQSARRALARRRRRRRYRIAAAWGILGTLVVGLGIGLTEGGTATLTWLRTHTRLFEVRQVDVASTRWVPAWDVVNEAGVNPGDDILDISLEAVAARVERHPRVLRAEVRRTWTRSIRIEIEEKPPVALWMGKTPMEVAVDGTLLGAPPPGGASNWPSGTSGSPRIRGVDLPLLTGVRQREAEPGTVLEGDAATEALEFLSRLRAYGDGGESWISEVHAGRASGLVAITLRGGIRVKIGDGKLSRRKIAALRTVLEQVADGAGGVEFIDARFRHQVIVKTS